VPRQHYDIAVVGGGLVGAAIAYGLATRVDRLAVVDEGDVAYRAARGNFGLVWVQSKGEGNAAYGRWTLGSAQAWPRLAHELLALTGIDVRLEQRGGLTVFLSDREARVHIDAMQRMLAQPGMPQYEWRFLAGSEMRDVAPWSRPRRCRRALLPARRPRQPVEAAVRVACGAESAITEMMAQARGVPASEIGYYRLRFPAKPLTLGELASLPQTDRSRAAVARGSVD
jgi:glycine/D-amino acid oxidase-like deaminating enzyme